MRYLFLILIMPLHAFSHGWAGVREIEMIQQRECLDGKGFEITFKANHNNPDSCSNSLVVDLACNQPGYQAMVSMVLTAAASKKPIDAWLVNCDLEGQARVTSVVVRP
jgi:hypothetical protein